MLQTAKFPTFGLAFWSLVLPLLSLPLMLIGQPAGMVVTVATALVLGGAIMSAVYHAETLAHYLGEPFGTLVLALAVTVIETSLIVSIMLSDDGSGGAQTLARDTLIAAIMIVMNGIVGLCLLVGGRRHHEQSYNQSGVSNGLAMLATLTVLAMILPNYTISASGPFYSHKQLIFVSVVSLVIYATFVVAQTIRHSDHFLFPGEDDHAHEAPVQRAKAIAAATLLIVALVGVVMLAKALSPSIESGVAHLGAPRAVVGIIIAGLVLAPEGFAAVRAARANRVQTSLNLAIGSALATIGLTIPAVAMASLWIGLELELGLSMRSMVMLAVTLIVSILTLGTGRTTVVQGVIHLVLFATFLFITLVP